MTTDASDVELITETGKQFLAVLRANDLDGIAGFYTADAVLMPPDQEAVTGREAIRDWFGAVLVSFTIEGFNTQQEEIVVAGDWAFRRGTFDWTLKATDSGETVQPKSKFLQIWERQPDGTWKVARGIWNSRIPK